MRDPATGGPHTAHTTNPVPVMLVGGGNRALLRDGRLADIAPTLLELMGLPQPKEMTGASLLQGTSSSRGHFGGCVPSGTDGRAQRGGVSDISAGWRTAVKRPKPECACLQQSWTSSGPDP